MKEKKHKFPLWIYPSTMETIERHIDKSGCRSKSDYIEQAVLFYSGYLSVQDHKNYIPNIVISCMKGYLGMFERRTSNILFKVAVEISMMNYLLASKYRISRDTMRNLRDRCIQEVRSYNGWISLEDAAMFRRDAE